MCVRVAAEAAAAAVVAIAGAVAAASAVVAEPLVACGQNLDQNLAESIGTQQSGNYFVCFAIFAPVYAALASAV